MPLCLGGPMDGESVVDTFRQRCQGWFEATYGPACIRAGAEAARYTLWTYVHMWEHGIETPFALWLAQGVTVEVIDIDVSTHLPVLLAAMPDGALRFYMLGPSGAIRQEGDGLVQDVGGSIRPEGRGRVPPLGGMSTAWRWENALTPELAGYDPFVADDKTLEESLALMAQIRARREGSGP